MTDVRELLHDIAEHTPSYDLTDTVLHRVRRRRRTARLVPVLVLPVLILAGAGLTVPWLAGPHHTPHPGGPGTAWFTPGTTSVPPVTPVALPSGDLAPPAGAPALPATGAVGAAALLVDTQGPQAGLTDGSAPLLYTGDRHWYRLPVQPSQRGGVHADRRFVGLSPDGHWLWYTAPNGHNVVRDLTGRYPVRELADTSVVRAWSGDGHWLLYAPAGDENGIGTRLDLTTAGVNPYPAADTAGSVRGVLPIAGDLMRAVAGAPPNGTGAGTASGPLRLQQVSLPIETVRHETRVDGAVEWVRSGPSWHAANVGAWCLTDATGRYALVAPVGRNGAAPDGRGTAAVVDLSTGRTGRVVDPTGAGDDHRFWQPTAVRPDGVLYVSTKTGAPFDLVLVDPNTGQARKVARVTGGSDIWVAGQVS